MNSIKSRITIVIVGMAVLVLVVGFLGMRATDRVHAIGVRIERTAAAIELTERVNGLLYASVMESRGIYMSTAQADLDRYAKGLDAFLDQIAGLANDLRPLILAEEAALLDDFNTRFDDFQRRRRQLSALARAGDHVNARKVGDNSENRASRQSFNKALLALSDTFKQRRVQAMRDSETLAAQLAWLLPTLMAGGAGLALGLALITLRRGLLTPLAQVVGRLEVMTAGDLDQPVPQTGRRDEIGLLARALDSLRLDAARQRGAEAEARTAAGARAAQAERLAQATSRFETQVGGLLGDVDQAAASVHAAAEAVDATVATTMRRSSEVASAAEQTAGNVQTVAAAAEELSRSIDEIGRHVGEAARISAQAASQTQSTNRVIQGLAGATARIGDVVKLITDIAAQTNLLALNATIEAARAGEAGKGFAVVAGEVKSLAGQTAKATEEITGQISQIQAETRSAVEAIAAITSTVDALQAISTRVAGAIHEQTAATGEIARSVSEAASGTDTVRQHIAEVRAANEASATLAADLGAASTRLSERSRRLAGSVQSYLDTVRQG